MTCWNKTNTMTSFPTHDILTLTSKLQSPRKWGQVPTIHNPIKVQHFTFWWNPNFIQPLLFSSFPIKFQRAHFKPKAHKLINEKPRNQCRKRWKLFPPPLLKNPPKIKRWNLFFFVFINLPPGGILRASRFGEKVSRWKCKTIFCSPSNTVRAVFPLEWSLLHGAHKLCRFLFLQRYESGRGFSAPLVI